MLLIVGAVLRTGWDYVVSPTAHATAGAFEGVREAVAARHTGAVVENLAVGKLAKDATFAPIAGAYVRDFIYKFANGLNAIIHGGVSAAGEQFPKIGEAISTVAKNGFKGGNGAMLAKAVQGLGPWGGALMLGYGGLAIGGIAMGVFALKAFSNWSRQMKGLDKDLKSGSTVWAFAAGSGALGAAGALMMFNPGTAVVGLGALAVGAIGTAGAWAYNKVCKSQLSYSAVWPYPLSEGVKWLFEPQRNG